VDDRIERSRLLYERALFGSDAGALAEAERELDGVEADLALARGRVIHGRFLQQRAGGRNHRCSIEGNSLPPSS
jgi:hypothetical protein